MEFNKEKMQELYPEAIMYEPMKIHASTDSSLKAACQSEEYFAQLKKDGYWYQFEKHEYNSYLFSRTASKKTGLLAEKIDNVPHIAKALKTLPIGTILVGEIYYPGGSSKRVTEVMGCLPLKAIERQKGERGEIHYYIHDILMYDGVDLVKNQIDNETRYKILEKIFYLHNLNNFDFLELAEAWDDNLYERVGTALAAGEEGMVLKKKTGIYEPGKRPTSNIKAKKVDFIDAIITGFEPPTKEYYGKDIQTWEYWIDESGNRLPINFHYGNKAALAVTKPYYMKWYNSRIKIGAYDSEGKIHEIGIIHSGISDELKKDMSENPQNYLDKVCSVQCMEVDPYEQSLRHGFYKGLREDKNAEDCTLKSIF